MKEVPAAKNMCIVVVIWGRGVGRGGRGGGRRSVRRAAATLLDRYLRRTYPYPIPSLLPSPPIISLPDLVKRHHQRADGVVLQEEEGRQKRI